MLLLLKQVSHFVSVQQLAQLRKKYLFLILCLIFISNTNSNRILVDLTSFQVFGIATDSNEVHSSNKNRPVLAQPPMSALSNGQKLFQVEFETNPLDKKCDYRIRVVSQSLEIKYNAVRSTVDFSQ